MLGNNIGDQLVLEPHDSVFQRQLLFLQPRNLQLIDDHFCSQRVDSIVEIAVLDSQLFE